MSIQTKRLPGLDGIRAIAALCILLGHIPQKDFCSWSVPAIPIPDLCAYTFLVLSGFLSGYKSHSINSYGTYIANKAKRLLPPYFLCILIVILSYTFSNKSDIVINRHLYCYLFLIPQVPFAQGNGIIPLVHLWFIGVLVLFYLVFPIICKKNGIKNYLIVIIVWLVLKFSIYLFVGSNSFWYRFVSCTALDCLFWGALIGRLFWRRSHFIQTLCENKMIHLLTWGLFLAFSFYRQYIPAPIRIQYFAVLSSLMILSQLGNSTIINLDRRFISFLGSISYEVYLFHVPIIIALSALFIRMNLPDNPILIYITCTVLSFTVAFFANRLLRLINGNCNRIQSRR